MGSQRSRQGLDLRWYRSSRCLLIFVLLTLPLSATTYFVDNCVTVGSDSNNGTSSSRPWLSAAKVNSSSFNPGDTISFRASCTWTNDSLSVPSSGTAGNVITFNKYGTGANPLFDGAVRSTGFVLDSGSIYKITRGQVTQVFEDNNGRLNVAFSKAAMAAGSWFWDRGTNALYVWSSDSGNPNMHVTSYSVMASALNMNGKGYLLFDSIDATRWGNEGYNSQDVDGANNITVQHSTSTWHGQRGFSFDANLSHSRLSNVILQKNTAHDQLGECFWIGDGSNITVTNNTCYNSMIDKSKGYCLAGNPACGGGGINVSSGANGVTVQDNYVHDIYDTPALLVEFQTGYARPVNVVVQRNLIVQQAAGEFVAVSLEGDGTLFYNNIFQVTNEKFYNVVFSNGGTNQKVYNNTLYVGGYWGVIYSSDDGASNDFENNIVLRSTSNGSIEVKTGATIGTIDYNDYYTFAYWRWSDGTNPGTLAAWRAKCSCDAHSINTDPKLNNPAGGDFTLQSSSPAIHAGANLTSVEEMGLNPRTSFPWGTLNRNSQGLGWEIGAFVFVQQIPPAPPTSLSATVK
jgi:parallel beta-helix repeat protein